MEIRIKSTGRIVTEEEYRAMHPLVSFATGKFFAPTSDADVVEETSPPAVSSTQIAVRDGVEQVQGKWRQKWKVQAKPAEVVEDELSNAKAARMIDINVAWERVNNSYFEHQGKYFECDAIAQQSINATNGYIALFGEFQEGWPGGWKASDGSYIAIGTLEEWKDFYKAMVRQGQSNFAYAQHLKRMVDEAETVEQVDAVVWGETEAPAE